MPRTTDKAQSRTFESLEYCGWTGDDISVFAREGAPLQGLDLNDVEIVVEMEEYQGDDEKLSGKSFAKVAWVNRLGGRGINVENAMPQGEALAIGERMKGIVLKSRSKGGAPPVASATKPPF